MVGGVVRLRLRMGSFQTNGGDLLVGEIVSALFNHYRNKVEPSELTATMDGEERPESSSKL